MKQAILVRRISLFVATMFLFAVCSISVSAHGDEEHEDADHVETQATVATTDIVKLEQMVKLLNQLIVLINALRIEQGHTAVQTTPVVSDDHEEMEVHHDEHSHETSNTGTVVSSTTPHLIIEVEPHNDKTHIHIRYTDKAEDMFFVDADLDDTAGIIAAVKARSGLVDDVIREALTYPE